MAPSADRPDDEAGFSLIEVLVALVIAGLALGAIAAVLASGALSDRTSGQVATALTLAQSEIASAGATRPLQPGASQGNFAGRFEWRRSIAAYDDPARDGPPEADRAQPGLRLYRITVAVSWSEGTRRRRVTLSTLRLGAGQP